MAKAAPKSRSTHPVAEPLMKQALEIKRKTLGEEHPGFATSCNNLALLYYSTDRYEEAEPLMKQALEIRRHVLGEEHPDFAASCHNLAIFRQDRFNPYIPKNRYNRKSVRRSTRPPRQLRSSTALSANALSGERASCSKREFPCGSS